MLPTSAMIALLIVCGLTAVSFLIGFVAVSVAPVGYQDDAGFHFGQDNEECAEAFAAHAEPKAV